MTTLVTLVVTLAAVGFAPRLAMAETCQKSTAAVAGTLLKVISRRPDTRAEFVHWIILTSSPLCIKIGGETKRGITDLQVKFADTVAEKQIFDWVGLDVAVKGEIGDPSLDDGITSNFVVKNARFVETNDAGEAPRE